MHPYAQALNNAAHNLFDSLGPLEDLGPELANTVANVYYRYALASGHVHNLSLALGVGEPMTQGGQKDLLAEVGVIVAQQEFIDDMIQRVRYTRKKNVRLAEYLRVLTLDTFKYRIARANAKTAVRRAIERRFRRTNEIAGLYAMMDRFARPQ